MLQHLWLWLMRNVILKNEDLKLLESESKISSPKRITNGSSKLVEANECDG